MDFDIKRLGLGEQIAAGGAVLLFIFFFFFDWWSVSFGSLGSAGVNGWDAHTLLRWLVLLTIIGAVGHAFMRATGRTVELPAHPGLILTVLAGITTVCLLFRMFINQPGPSNKIVEIDFGAYVGLLCLIAITIGAWLSMSEEAPMPSSAAAAPPTA